MMILDDLQLQARVQAAPKMCIENIRNVVPEVIIAYGLETV